jgi:CRISPR-associated protein Cst2
VRSKCLEIAYLVRVERANLNASGTEGNVTLLKKVRDIDGNGYVYVSGVAVKYWIKEMLKGMEERGIKCSPVLSAGEENPVTKVKEEQITSVGDPEKYIDDDLFGFLLPQAERKRIAPVKTNGLISLFPYTGDINLGVRYDPKGKEHALWDLEITSTVFRGNWLIELDRIGKFGRDEIGNSKELQPEEKEKRIKAFLECFFNLFGGAKQSSFLTSTEPRIVCLVFLDRKTLAIFDRLKVDRDFKLEEDLLLQGFQLHKDEIKEVYIGIDPTCVKNNLNEIKKKVSEMLEGKVVEVEELAKIKKKVLSENFKFY